MSVSGENTFPLKEYFMKAGKAVLDPIIIIRFKYLIVLHQHG